jgi:DNA-binding NtrC family response regulator
MKKNIGNILIIDDNEEALIALQMLLSGYFSNVISEKNPNLLLSHLTSSQIDVVILDMNFAAGVNTGNEGLYWLRKILESDPEIQVILLTAYGDVKLAVKGLKAGAADFIQKPWENEQLVASVTNLWKLRRSKMQVDIMKIQQMALSEHQRKTSPMITGKSVKMLRVLDTINRVADTDANVLITGESGTGKELVAREIHSKSARKNAMFVKVDMGALNDTLFESELFGHVKGAFTDALEDRPGRIEIAHGGTLFLDEIGNLPLTLQPKLLTVLQSRTVTRLGSNVQKPVDIRLVSATNLSLKALSDQRNFREDLLYRLNTIVIDIPPLRERKEDLELLTEYFIKTMCSKYKKTNYKISAGLKKKLHNYSWPGNIRELENMIEKAVILADGNTLTPNDFQLQPTENTGSSAIGDYNLEEHEKMIISKALDEFNYNLSEAAANLGITRATLYRKIQKYEL